jgi:anti-sigma regulatory factor (Ser/Thr protein kinase)
MDESNREKSFAAQQGQIPAALEFITANAKEAGLSGTGILKLRLVAEEAVTNVCNYAYPDRAGTLEIRVAGSAGHLTVTISDEGKPFNPVELAQPDVSLGIEERPVGGLGVFLIRKFVDEIAYERVGNKNVLRIKIAFGVDEK